jgi:hypothetical protein
VVAAVSIALTRRLKVKTISGEPIMIPPKGFKVKRDRSIVQYVL